MLFIKELREYCSGVSEPVSLEQCLFTANQSFEDHEAHKLLFYCGHGSD